MTASTRVEQGSSGRVATDAAADADRRRGSALMTFAGVAFVGYGLVFLAWNFAGGRFELGVEAINGVSRTDLNAFEPGVLHYISHLHVATAAFIISTGIAVAGLAWYGVRQGHLWAWTTSVVAAVLALAIALPMHWMDLFSHDWVTHLGPVYLGAAVFVAGALLALRGLPGRSRRSSPSAR